MASGRHPMGPVLWIQNVLAPSLYKYWHVCFCLELSYSRYFVENMKKVLVGWITYYKLVWKLVNYVWDHCFRIFLPYSLKSSSNVILPNVECVEGLGKVLWPGKGISLSCNNDKNIYYLCQNNSILLHHCPMHVKFQLTILLACNFLFLLS